VRSTNRLGGADDTSVSPLPSSRQHGLSHRFTRVPEGESKPSGIAGACQFDNSSADSRECRAADGARSRVDRRIDRVAVVERRAVRWPVAPAQSRARRSQLLAQRRRNFVSGR